MNKIHFFFSRYRDRYRNKVRLLHLCNYVFFIVFSFIFLRELQSDVLMLTLHRTFGLPLMNSPIVIAFIITLLLTLLKVVVNKSLRLKGRRHALSFVPSFLLLTLLCDLVPNLSLLSFLPLLVGVAAFYFLIRRKQRGFRSHDTFWTLSIPNLVCMLCCFTFVSLFSNTNDVFHYELRIQRDLLHGNDQKANAVGLESLATGHLLTSLRAYSLSKSGLLGELLFEYPIPNRDSDLFIYPEEEKRMLLPLNTFWHYWGFPTNQSAGSLRSMESAVEDSMFIRCHPSIGDYWLCTLLLKKQLDAFARWLPRFYSTSHPHVVLPKHYREALILYKSRFLHPRLVFYSVSTEVNYRDFMELYNQYPDERMRNNFTRRLYGNTYWWYYYFHS